MATSNIQFYKNIVEQADIARRNWKLMYLDIKNLSGTQINKLNDQINTSTAIPNKIKFIRFIRKIGIQNFDIDSFFMSVKSCKI